MNKLATLKDHNHDYVRNNPDADITLIQYGDYTCNHCKHARDIVRRSVHRLGDKVQFIFRQKPSLLRQPTSDLAATAALAAGQQGKFWAMHDALFESGGDITEQSIRNIAEEIGLDIELFENDRVGDKVEAHLEKDIAYAAEANVQLTPTLFINGRHYEDAWDEASVMEAIEQPLGIKMKFLMRDFFDWAASSGVVLILATVAALMFVNLGGFEAYEHIRHMDFGFQLGAANFILPIEVWINDALMAVFFLLVGIEIKREILDGELSDLSGAMLPLFGAIGGMIVPALVYYALNAGTETAGGWGVPMATDIAFTLGILALLGKRVPVSLFIFVSALAIVDDLGAILVIAIFYGHGFHVQPFLLAIGIVALMLLLNKAKVYDRVPYVILGIILWACIYNSGLHATLAGVLTAICIPSRPSGNIQGVAAQTEAIFETELNPVHPDKVEKNTMGSHAMRYLKNAFDRLREPGYHVEQSLKGWTNFLILPLFAFFNTGILITASSMNLISPESLGVILGLVIGKPVGILLCCWIAIKLGIAKLSAEISIPQLIGASFLCGVGFTMSIFIATASFEGSQLEPVKMSILVASFLAAIIGSCFFFIKKEES